MAGKQKTTSDPTSAFNFRLILLINVLVFFCSDQGLLLAVGVSLGLLTLLLLGLMTYYLWRRKKDQSPYEELPSTLPPVPACSAPVIQVSLGSWLVAQSAFFS